MGGYHLAKEIAATTDTWVIAAIVGYMAGATIVFSIPVGLAILHKRDHKYMALGIMSGILTVPIGVFITSILLYVTSTPLRDDISTTTASTHVFGAGLGTILVNLSPLIVIVVAIALGLWFVPDAMIRGFMIFGKFMDTGIKLVLALSIVEYFTGAFSTLFGAWGFDPIIADEVDQFRALEIAGYIGIMLAGAFPMVYAIRVYLAKPLSAFGQKVGISTEGSAGMLATMANIIAMYHLVKTMPARDKVINIATTNYPERLDRRIVSRPRRFDRIISRASRREQGPGRRR
jgi:ethanolamine transporter